ncbi:UDPglucose--hexose-1-phosphate uridylyltransferase [Catalinimonas alkaloidigena]|uniref:UDP-glucose--hexose-1-phosphate uridylyltransferase n=1 Tax=Catalinimonas alkaloidigena TaxID=1075417 RepID=UPI0024049C48|nr:UDP-glucose--hexose-1-phosphate uridylyltransferase [Catalinimonas alkaloidigena]MDF9800517.1 UDPglucose--hexose-1-phosphate uridylyltransferase [Catalinimonas alkaloidigena]
MDFDLKEHPHRRYNPLTGEHVLVSPHRMKRPWQGQVEKLDEEKRPEYDPKCYLCPGNSRAGGEQNPQYESTFVFTNDFAALKEDVPGGSEEKGNLLRAQSEKGICRVICFSPRHDLTLPQMEVAEIVKVVELWQKEFEELGSHPEINYVQIFENKGQMMGCSNPHPHGQIWAQSTVPMEPVLEGKHQGDYLQKNGSSLLEDYVKLELEEKERIVLENEHFVAVVPFWAVWPFETMIISKRHLQNILQFTGEEKLAYAEILKKLTILYDNLFETSFPYSAGIHQAPTDGLEHTEWHFHHHFYPPLLRSATVKKFMVGYEMLGDPQRDITAESSAERLRNLPKGHYK